MSQKNEELQTVLRELETRGVKHAVKRLSKHVRVEWTYHDVKQSYTVSTTSSDVRARLNARAHVRKLLKAAEAKAPKKVVPIALGKALALPEYRDTIGERLTRIEADLVLLADLILEILPDKKSPRQTGEAPRETVEEKLMRAMDFREPRTKEEIAKAAGVLLASATSTLSTMKRLKMVDNPERGKWRKLPLPRDAVSS